MFCWNRILFITFNPIAMYKVWVIKDYCNIKKKQKTKYHKMKPLKQPKWTVEYSYNARAYRPIYLIPFSISRGFTFKYVTVPMLRNNNYNGVVLYIMAINPIINSIWSQYSTAEYIIYNSRFKNICQSLLNNRFLLQLRILFLLTKAY